MAGRSMPILLEAPAKLNLSLAVLRRREDGFHEIESLIVGLALSDSLSVMRSAAVEAESGRAAERGSSGVEEPFLRLTVRHAGRLAARAAVPARRPIPLDRTNLVVKAVLALARAAGELRGLEIELVKRIPAAAGLGGGSSDAAAALRGAAAAWGIDWPARRLAAVAAEIGSDVPWFLEGRPAVAMGRGERLEAAGPLPLLFAVVACPAAGLSTAEVYRHCRPDAAGSGKAADLARLLAAGRLAAAFDRMHNDLESPASRLCGEVERLLAAMGRAAHGGPSGGRATRSAATSSPMLTGSGSACFLLVRTLRQARGIAARLAAEGWPWVVATRLVAQAPALRSPATLAGAA
jgi:4-diphosphocytidyl-2-C-methyl-D-erythritol kinase